jgi:hypothetical protein
MTWDMTEDAVMLAKAQESLRQMQATEGAASTEDTYTMRIPGKTLKEWHDNLSKVVFRLRGTLEL